MSPILRVQSPLFILQWKMVLENLEKEWCMMCNDCLVYIITKPIDCSSKLTKQTKEKRRRFRNFEVNSILSIPSPNSISRQSRFRRRRRCGGTIERGQCVGARDSVGSFARSSYLLSILASYFITTTQIEITCSKEHLHSTKPPHISRNR